MTNNHSSISIEDLMKIQDGAAEKAVGMISEIANALLVSMKPYLLWFIGGFVLLLAIAILLALAGNTRLLGSVLYHCFYFGVISLSVAIFGFGIFFNAYIDIFFAVLYLFSFWLSGRIMARFSV